MLWLSSSNHFPRRFASFEATRGPTTPGAFWYPLQNEAGHSRGSTGIGVWPSGQICRPDDLGNAMFLNYSLTRMLALSAPWALGAFALVVAVTTACFWRPLFSREAPWASATGPYLPENLFQASAWTGHSVELGGSQGRARREAITMPAVSAASAASARQPCQRQILITQFRSPRGCLTIYPLPPGFQSPAPQTELSWSLSMRQGLKFAKTPELPGRAGTTNCRL